MGRRRLLLLRLSVLLALAAGAGGGCASRISHVSTSQRQAGSVAPPSRYVATDDAEDAAIPASASASALVFRPPVAAGEQMPDLSRAARQPSAFVGFEDPIVEYYDVTTIDRQVAGGSLGRSSSGSGFGWDGGACDRYERRAVTEKIGVLHR
jgi:hypothetical protein